MLSRHLTDDELKVVFNEILDGIVGGRMRSVPTDTGLDQQTVFILNLLAAQRVKRPADIRACRIEFARMLDGTHAIEAQERDDAEWAELSGN